MTLLGRLLDIAPGRVVQYHSQEDWRAARVAGHAIGGSAVAAILGVSPFATPMDEWWRRQPDAPPVTETQAMRRGTVLEPAVLRLWAESDSPARHVEWCDGLIIRHAVHPWAIGSVDALHLDDGELGLVEIKTTSRAAGWGPGGVIEAWDDAATDAVPAHYALQAYWYLECTGLPWLDLVAMLPRFELTHYRLMRDEAVQSRLLERVGAWRERHLVRGERPPLDGSDGASAALQSAHASPAKVDVEATADDERLLEKLLTIRATMAALGETEAVIKRRIEERIGDAYRLTGSCASAVWTLPGTRSSFDAASFKREHPELAARYTKETPTARSLRVTEKK